MSTHEAEDRQKLEQSAKKETKTLYKNKILHMQVVTTYIPNEGSIERGIVHHPGAVSIIPVMPDGEIILIRQYRQAIDEVILEIPAGIIEEGEPIGETAQRELQEEIGYKAHKMIYFTEFYPSPGFCDEHVHIFIAKNLEKSPLPKDIDEAIDVVIYTPEEILRLLEGNEIMDAKTLIGLQRYFLWKKNEFM